MLKIKQIFDDAQKEGYVIMPKDVSFAIYVLSGYDLDDCLIYSANHEVKTDTRQTKLKIADKKYLQTKAKTLMEEDRIKWLLFYLRPVITKDISDYVTHNLNDFDFIPKSAKEVLVQNNIVEKLIKGNDDPIEELSEKDIKKALTLIARRAISTPDDIDIKETVPLFKFYMDRFAPKNEEDVVAKHIIIAEEKHNAICNLCSREITVSNGLINICEHCGCHIDLRILKS